MSEVPNRIWVRPVVVCYEDDIQFFDAASKPLHEGLAYISADALRKILPGEEFDSDDLLCMLERLQKLFDGES